MSGKSKQARVKNNAKPSSSSRSAELLGNTVTTFVGFSVHPEHGIISLTPGLSDNWTDSLKSNVDPQLQLILRKMSKKDPVTKVKALQEFCELLNCCDVLEVKGILPLWPKLYQNFANDFDHRVRESSQEVLKVMALKFKKLMAPYIKQLAPFWIASQFDNYAPAASIASSSLTATFNSKVRDVCIFCRNEIMEYVVRNITFHSSSTFSSSKNCVPEEAEHKYQRVVHCSLKTVSFFLQLVNDIEYEKIRESFYNILTSSKFWSFSKSKDPRVKSSWFEVLYTMLLNKSLENLLINFKDQIIAVSFENISESEPLVTPHVWGCILLEQSMFDDWYDVISFKKTVMPKISALLRHGRNRNFDIISPNLLPFLSKISEKSLEGSSIHDFYKQFFDDIKEGLITFENTSKTEISAFSAAYYECLRYVVQQINNNINDIQEESVDADVLDLEIVAKRLFSENIFNLLTWCFTKGGLIAKHVMMHTSMLIAFWSDPAKSSKLYVELLNTFWDDILSFMLSGFSDERDDEEFLTLIIELMYKLYNANSKTEHQKVNFVLKDEEENSKLDVNKNDIDVTQNKSSGSHKEQSIRKSTSVIYYESDLKNLVIQLVRLCVDKCINKLGYKYLPKIRKLSHLFKDADFYARISEEKTVEGTLYQFLRLMDTIDDNSYDDTIDMTFQALNFIPKDERDDFIKENLLTISHPSVQYSVINRLLSHPLVVEPEVQTMLSSPDACTILINFATDVVNCHSKDSLNLLRKCFFQNEEGEIPINQKTAEQILEILSEPLTTDKENKADLCGSFIAQIMPVICGEGNTSPEFQRNMFLKLFQMSIERISDQFISEDTLWEISTSWQDALSSQDIVADIGLFQDCKAIVEKYLQKNQYLTIEIIESIATSITQFLVCSTEHIEDEQEHSCKIYLMIEEIFEATNNRIFNKNIKQMQELCLFLEALLGKVSTNNKFNDQCMKNIEMLMTLRQVLLNCCIIYRLVCKVPKTTRSVHDDDRNMIMNKNWSPALYDETLRCISIASVGDSLYSISQSEFKLGMELLQLKEKLKSILRNGHQDFISNLKNRMLNEVTKNVNISATRSLLYLVHINQYNTFEENATVVLFDDLTVMLSSRNDLRAYVNTLQFFLPHLSSKVMTSELLIERTEFRDKWIRAAILRCLVRNNFNSDYNKTSEYLIVEQTMGFIFELSQLQHANKELLLYNVEIHKQAVKNVVNTVEFMNVLKEVITNYPYELTTKNWDTIRVGLCSWVLSSSKSIDHLQNPRVAIFLVNVFKFYATLANFIKNERQKSSTEFLRNIIDEWDKLFDREISLVLFKIYHNLLENQELSFRHSVCYNIILEAVSPSMEYINYQIVYNHYKTQPTNVNIISFLLKNLSNSAHCIRTTCLNILKHMTQYFVGNDICSYKNIENLNSNTTTGDWHFLCMFEEYIERYGTSVHKYFSDFTFKLNEVDELKPIDRNKSLSYMFLWDCIIHACANSPMSLRSVYTNWLHEKRYEEKFLFFLIRVMPVEILKNHDSKLMCTDVFKGLTWNQIQDRKLAVEKYACHLYTEVLRKLPAVVRKWYNTCQWRQKTFIDKLTTNFVSPIICNEELGAIGTKKEKHVNMQVTVHTSTREVIAVYSIDEVRMELVITLAQNHPLGPVKVATGKQIGGRLSSRNTGMQLTIFLTHQNGSIFDGLTLWKNNLDKKFEGIEECYVCYTVIHQETCQLPKLTCKTCKKKFHGPCLYKWFTTSSKSTCPICRNIF